MRIIPTTQTQRAIVLVFHGLAFITTVLRLTLRARSGRLWWDDLWSFCAMICSVVSVLVFLIPVPRSPTSGSTFQVPVEYSIMTVNLVFYLAVLWFARLSIAVTIVRLLLREDRFRTPAKAVSVFFGFSGTLLILLRIINCGTKFDKPPLCQTPRYAVYLDLVLDILADAWLISAPLVMLVRTNISDQHRRLISGIFCCGLFITATSVLHIAYLMTQEHLMTALTAHIQAGVAVVVCNLLVIVTYVYRRWASCKAAPTLEPPKIPDMSSDVPPERCTKASSVIPLSSKPSIMPPSNSLRESSHLAADNDDTRDFSLTELGSSMLGGSSHALSSFGHSTTLSNAAAE